MAKSSIRFSKITASSPVGSPRKSGGGRGGRSGVIDVARYETTCLGPFHEQSGEGVVSSLDQSGAQALQFELAPSGDAKRRGGYSLPNVNCPRQNERTRRHCKTEPSSRSAARSAPRGGLGERQGLRVREDHDEHTHNAAGAAARRNGRKHPRCMFRSRPTA